MQQFFFILLSWRLFTVQHVSGIFPPIIRSLMTVVAAFGFTFVSWWQSCCFHAASAVIKLLMMGRGTPETCWAVNKRQDNKLKKIVASGWFIWTVRWCTDLQTLNCIYNIWYLSHRYCYLPRSWKSLSVLWVATHSTLKPVQTLPR
jgi:hypothetical protein